MFAKLKKKIADEAATGPWPGGPARMPRSISKESVTSAGADSGDDFPSDGSSSREDLSLQLFRRNEHIRKLEVKLSDYAEQVRNLQKIKEKLENALETHQDSFVKKLQEQNETHQTSIAKMAEGMTLALEKKDQEWREKLSHLEKERKILSAQLQEMREQSLNLFQKRDEIEELEGFQQQELAKVKHMLLKKEESLAQMERELGSSTQLLLHAREDLQNSQASSSRLSREVQELLEQRKNLEMERDELRDAGEKAEKKTTLLEERSHELQALIQRLSVDLQKAQLAASNSEKRLEMLQGDHESLKLEFEGQKQKMVAEAEDKQQLVGHLQEKVATLEKRFEGSLSGDEHFRELFKEKSAVEQRLEATQQQFLTAQSSHKESLCLMETQINQLNSRLATEQARLGEKEESLQSLQESSLKQLQDLERALQLAREATTKCQGDIEEKELQVQKLQTDLELERIRSQEGLSSAQAQWMGEIGQLQEQVAALEAARALEREAAQQLSSQLENENADLKGKRTDLEWALRKQETELGQLKTELRNKAETLEVMLKEREELQQQVANLSSSLQEKDQLIVDKTDILLKQEVEVKSLRQGQDTLLLQVHQLQSSLESCQRQAAEKETAMQEQLQAFQAQLQEQQEHLLASKKQAAVLELASIALEDQLHLSEDGEAEPNGELASSDIIQLQKENRDLEQHIAEKNKMIKQLQQRMAELKKTLQKELKIRPDGEVPEGPTAALTVTNNSDLNDSREINFEYLKHVVLKFMSCRESEALHLIKALSVLLNFSREEENMLRETLEYKMSWFGSKPPPRGSIRPSISSPRTPWS